MKFDYVAALLVFGVLMTPVLVCVLALVFGAADVAAAEWRKKLKEPARRKPSLKLVKGGRADKIVLALLFASQACEAVTYRAPAVLTVSMEQVDVEKLCTPPPAPTATPACDEHCQHVKEWVKEALPPVLGLPAKGRRR